MAKQPLNRSHAPRINYQPVASASAIVAIMLRVMYGHSVAGARGNISAPLIFVTALRVAICPREASDKWRVLTAPASYNHRRDKRPEGLDESGL